MPNEKQDPATESTTLYYKAAFLSRYLPTTPADGLCITPGLKIWIRHPAELGYDDNAAYPLQIDASPTKKPLKDVVVDDHTHDGGYTTLGPRFPHAYASGGVYMAASAIAEAIAADRKAAPAHLITCTDRPIPIDETIFVQKAGESVTRHHGFYGTRLYQHGNQELWIVWNPGTWLPDRPDAGMPGSSAGGPCGHWRSPRKLWIPTDATLPKKAMPRDNVEKIGDTTADRIFLEQSYASFVADLDVPKQPTASSEGDFSLPSREDRKREWAEIKQRDQDELLAATAAAGVDLFADVPKAASVLRDGGFSDLADYLTARGPYRHGRRPPSAPYTAAQPPGGNLCVMSAYQPGEMYEIRNRIKKGEVVSVTEGQTLVDALADYLEKSETRIRSGELRFANLDIIGHSRSRDGVLKIGELALTSIVAMQQFSELAERDILARLGIRRIRLLGCRTSQARGAHVVRVIREYTNLEVYSSRADLFAVHYDDNGFRPDAFPLLVNYDAVEAGGPGDPPPRDDYPRQAPDDDDDENDDPIPLEVQAPGPFAISVLSDVNAAAISARHYLFWNWQPAQFQRLEELLHRDVTVLDNPLLRADYEVLVKIAETPRLTSDFRSFDLFLGERPRLRLNYQGASYAFYFRDPANVHRELVNIGIAL